MNFFKKRVKSRKTIYYVCGIPVYIKRLTTNDMAYNISKKIRKLEICAYPEITSLPPAVGQKKRNTVGKPENSACRRRVLPQT